ncbi:phytoene desaturase [Aggregicoccus sp. 17bor-14]|uniref:phytoene desaturase family protein n=1 Tax=Myxococcaceae TaxID=31 RepID=UPI00129C14B2|nr:MULTISPECIES: phytoene desaturase family protein [Myxococcaceae]MBF5042989.1 phytoene desaturase [Simulacricoccus sp. 17bor-14]MRI88755.1 phytoene desaturase [Aggregicoccus sp. 17bor-14]
MSAPGTAKRTKGEAPTALVVGAGVGGLAAAARLARQGFRVRVHEKTGGPGGRCGQLALGGFRFDLGPTIVLMPEVFEETFRALGRRLEDYLTLERCEPNYRIHYRDGSDITFTSELTAMGRELERIEPGSFQRYLAFLAQGRTQYEVSLAHFVGRDFTSVLDYLRPAMLRNILKVRAHRRAYAEVSRFFQDERLRAALTFQTMYLGVSPFHCPAVYALLPFTELGVGVWFPKGGLYAIPLALERVAREEGVSLHYESPVERILTEGGRAVGVRLAGGREERADLVLCNADLPYAYERLLDPAATRLKAPEKLRYTSSGLLFYWGLERRVPGLGHHTVFLGRGYRQSFEDIFERFRVPEDPSFYVNVPCRTDPSLAPEGQDGLYVLVPVPHQKEGQSPDWRTEAPRVRAQVLARLAEEGFPLAEEDLAYERILTPDDWVGTFNLARGSAFGLAQNFFQVGPFRPANEDPNVSGLFFVGASTRPGTGLPTVLISARLAAERVAAWARRTGLAPAQAPLPTAATAAAAAVEDAA